MPAFFLFSTNVSHSMTLGCISDDSFLAFLVILFRSVCRVVCRSLHFVSLLRASAIAGNNVTSKEGRGGQRKGSEGKGRNGGAWEGRGEIYRGEGVCHLRHRPSNNAASFYLHFFFGICSVRFILSYLHL